MLGEAREPRVGANPILDVIFGSSANNRTFLTGELTFNTSSRLRRDTVEGPLTT